MKEHDSLARKDVMKRGWKNKDIDDVSPRPGSPGRSLSRGMPPPRCFANRSSGGRDKGGCKGGEPPWSQSPLLSCKSKNGDESPLGSPIADVESGFIGIVSHELRTPLTTIREGVSQVLNGMQGKITKAQHKLLSIVLSESDQLKRTIDTLLDCASIKPAGDRGKRLMRDSLKKRSSNKHITKKPIF